MEKDVQVVILAAGKGTRMKQNIPKALTPVAGKPILQYLFESIIKTGFGLPIVVTSSDNPRLCDVFGGKCDYAIQKEQLGTGHALSVAKEKIGEAEVVVVLYGDHPFISTKALTELVKKHTTEKNAITMMTTTVPFFDGWYSAFLSWGRIVRNQNGTIEVIREYKDASEEERSIKELNPSLFCFEKKWLWSHIDQLKNTNVQQEYYLTDLVEMAIKEGSQVSTSSLVPEEAIGINTPEDRIRAEQIIEEKI